MLVESLVQLLGKAGRHVKVGSQRLSVELPASAAGQGSLHPVGEAERPRGGAAVRRQAATHGGEIAAHASVVALIEAERGIVEELNDSFRRTGWIRYRP